MIKSGGVHGQDCSTARNDAGLTPAKSPQANENEIRSSSTWFPSKHLNPSNQVRVR